MGSATRIPEGVTWYADVGVITNTPFTDDDIENALDALNANGASISTSRDGLAGTITLAVEADTALDASAAAFKLVTTALPQHDFIVVKLDARTESVMDAELSELDIPPLVGYAEIADMAGVTRQRAKQFAEIPGFPAAVVETASGPLRLRHSVEAWLAHRNTRPGRPRAEATA